MCAGIDLSYKWRKVSKYLGSKGESKHGDIKEETAAFTAH